MAPHSRPGLRKQPWQDRAEATVERILDAGARMLIAYGYDGASTNRIAHEAGLSPGSLYQYFSNKDAIVITVVDRLVSELVSRIAAPFREVAGVPVEQGTKTVLTTLITALDAHADLLRAVVDHVPPLGGSAALGGFEQRVGDFVHHQLAANRDRLRHGDLDITAWLVVQTTVHLSIRYVVDRPPIPRERFVDELTGMLLSYAYAG